MLLNSARTYVLMAQLLHEQGYDGKWYLLRAKWCIKEYRLLKQNELTRFIRLVA